MSLHIPLNNKNAKRKLKAPRWSNGAIKFVTLANSLQSGFHTVQKKAGFLLLIIIILINKIGLFK